MMGFFCKKEGRVRSLLSVQKKQNNEINTRRTRKFPPQFAKQNFVEVKKEMISWREFFAK
jgi:hypothetical protein